MIRSDVSSVYRSLERLEELGVVRHVHVGHGPGLYSLEREPPQEYLVCERCGRVDIVDAAGLEKVRAEIHQAFRFEASFSHFPLVGVCERCQRETIADDESSDQHVHAHNHGAYVHSHPHSHHQPAAQQDHRHGHR